MVFITCIKFCATSTVANAESDSEQTQPEGENEPSVEDETTPEGVTEPEGEGESEGEGEPEGEDEPEGEVEPNNESEPESETETETEAESVTGGETVSEGETEPGGKTAGEAESTSEAEVPVPEAEASGSELILLIVAYSIVILLVVGGNVALIIIIIRNKSLRKNPTNNYLISLLISRAIIGALVVPAKITGLFSEAYLGSVLCKLCHYCGAGSAASSVFTIVSIAVNKYRALDKNSIDSREPVQQSIRVIIIVWVVGFVYAIKTAFSTDQVEVTMGGLARIACTTIPTFHIMVRYFIVVDIICLFIIPFVIIVICYTLVIGHLTKTEPMPLQQNPLPEKQIPINGLSTFGPVVDDPQKCKDGWMKDGAEKAEEKKTKQIADKRNLSTVRMLIVLTTLFTICTAAPMTLKAYVVWGGTMFDGFDRLEDGIYIFAYSNAWINIIVFMIFRQDLRHGVKKVFRPSNADTQVQPLKK